MLTVSVIVIDALLFCVLVSLIMRLRMIVRNPGATSKELKEDTGKRTEKMVITAMMLAFGLALKYFSVTLPLFGANGMRISFGGIFTAFPALLFGPFYGGITSALSDMLGFFMKPDGDYNILFTLTAFLGGFLKGLIWLVFKKTRKNTSVAVKCVLAAFLALFLAFGAVTIVSLNKDSFMSGLIAHAEQIPDKETAVEFLENGDPGAGTKFVGALVSSKGAKSYQKYFAMYANLSGIGLALTGLLGLAGIGTDFIIRAVKRKKDGGSTADDGLFSRVFSCVLISGLIVTTINTAIIIKLYGIQVPFVIYWIPRLAEEIIVSTIQAYFITVLYESLEKLFRRRKYI